MMGDGPNPNGKHSKYSVEDGKLVRKGDFCPVCGPGVFLGVHKDRKVCGKCGSYGPADWKPVLIPESGKIPPDQRGRLVPDE